MKKWINGEIIEMTPEEIAAMKSMQIETAQPEPTIEERIVALEGAILELAEVITNG